MHIHRLLLERDGALVLAGLQPRVETMLGIAGVKKPLDVHASEADAVLAFRDDPGRGPAHRGHRAAGGVTCEN